MSKKIGAPAASPLARQSGGRKPAFNISALATFLGVEELDPKVAVRLLSYMGARQKLSKERNPARRARLDKQARALREGLRFDSDQLERAVRLLVGIPGELARVKIMSPAVKARDVDLKAARKAAREFFQKNPRALERDQS